MAKCTVELDLSKLEEAHERFKKICDEEMEKRCGECVGRYKTDEVIILRPTTFMKAEVFEMTKEVWEKEIPNSVVIPHSMDVLNRKREWIPTSLCLPEESRPVLVTVKIWPDEHGYHYTTSIDVHDHNGWRDNGNNVVAWQPLPAPYKGE